MNTTRLSSATRGRLTLVAAIGVLVAPALAQSGAASSHPSSQPSGLDPQRAYRPLSSIAGVPAPPVPAEPRRIEDLPEIRERYEAARELADDDKYPEAIARLDAALNLPDGDCYEVLYLLSLCKSRLNRLGEARIAAERAAELRPGDADAHFLLGRIYEQQRQPDRAIAHYRTATLAAEHELNNPRVTAAWGRLGRALADVGYLTAAVEAFERFDDAVWEEAPEHRSARDVAVMLVDRPYGAFDWRIDLLTRLGRPADALEVSAWALNQRPDDAYLLRRHIRALLFDNQASRAFQLLRERGVTTGGTTGLLTLAVEAARAAGGEIDPWVRETEGEIAGGRASPERMRFVATLAQRLDQAGEHDQAVRLWQALALVRSDADVVWGLATALRRQGKLELALDSLMRFVRGGAADSRPAGRQFAAVPRAGLVEWMRTLKSTDEFLRLVQEYTNSSRRDRDYATDFVLGATAAAAGQLPLAEELFRSTLDRRPDFAAAHAAWGQLLLTLYRWDDARAHAESAIKLAPELAQAHFILAEAQSGLDQNDAAEASYKSAIRLAEGDAPSGSAGAEAAEYALGLARFYRRTNNSLGAQRYFQQALAADPCNGEAVEGLIESYIDGGKLEFARTQLEKAEGSDIPEDSLRRARTSARFAHTLFREDHMEVLARQFESYPSDVLTGLKLAAGFATAGRTDDALRALEKIQSIAPDDDTMLAWLARVRSRRLEYDAAIAIIQRLAERYPNRLDVLGALAEGNLADFRIDDARATLRRILSPPISARLDAPARHSYRARLYATYALFSDFEGALAALDEWLKESPGDDDLLAEQFDALINVGRPRDAVEAATKWLDAKPTDPVRRAKFGDVCVKAKDFRAAETRARAWVKEDSAEATWTGLLIEILLAEKRAEDALGIAQKFAPQSKSAEIQSRLWLARCHAVAKQIDAGVAELDALLDDRIVQSNGALVAEIRERLIRMLTLAKQFDRALERCERWLALAKDDPTGREFLIEKKREVLQAAGRNEECAAIMERMFDRDPDDPGLNNNLGYTWLEMGKNLDKATAMIRRAVAASPLNSAYLDSLGWVLYKTGDFDGARKFLSRAVRLRDGNDPLVFDHLGDAEYRLGDRNAARATWQKALDMLSERSDDERLAEHAALLASLRTKLAAFDRSQPVDVAPVAAESK